MATVLIISSQTAASQVGASAARFCLQCLGHEVVVLPTVLLGRHPGWGKPGGGAVTIDHLSSMWAAIAQQDMTFDAVLTGYMPSTEHVEITAEIIAQLQERGDNPLILSDPVMGDTPKDLYIPEDVAEAIKSRLIPLADIVTPNRWEIEYLTGDPALTLRDAVKALSHQGAREAIMTSAERDSEIGAVLHVQSGDYYCHHEKFPAIPNGGGDSFAALYLGHRLNRLDALSSLRMATSSIFDILQHAMQNGLPELPLITRQRALSTPPTLCRMDNL